MKNWTSLLVRSSTSIRDVLAIIDRATTQLALVVDDDGRLMGTVSDGDVRRALLRGHGLDRDVGAVMHRAPLVVGEHESRERALSLLQARGLQQVPVVSSDGTVVGLLTLRELLEPPRRENIVVLMAGGLGERLRPLTERIPKPMLPVGGRPILETIVLQFMQQGFRRFAISVNYHASVIEAHFGDGSQWGAEISYIREPKRLGTAGSLRLLTERPSRPIIVMNGDILTKVSMSSLLAFHDHHAAAATMCVREHEYQVPFGVIETSDVDIVSFTEKPLQRWLVNAGIYVLDPSALEHIPADVYFDMPALFDALRGASLRTTAFTVRDYWLDIGRPADFERANIDFASSPLDDG